MNRDIYLKNVEVEVAPLMPAIWYPALSQSSMQMPTQTLQIHNALVHYTHFQILSSAKLPGCCLVARLGPTNFTSQKT